MCRNIKKLRSPDRQPTDEELRDAALQFIRKISGYPKPSKANRKAFDRAVREVATAGRRLFGSIEVREAETYPNPGLGRASADTHKSC